MLVNRRLSISVVKWYQNKVEVEGGDGEVIMYWPSDGGGLDKLRQVSL